MLLKHLLICLTFIAAVFCKECNTMWYEDDRAVSQPALKECTISDIGANYFGFCIRTYKPQKCHLYAYREKKNRRLFCSGCNDCGMAKFSYFQKASDAKAWKRKWDYNNWYCLWLAPNENGWVSSKYYDYWKI